MPVLNCLIVEDEDLAVQVIADYVKQVPSLNLKGICEDVFSAMEVLRNEKIDIILLDINLPRVNGLEFIKTLNNKYHIILTTAYHQYALEAFNQNVIDYLLKPITFERFLKAINKVIEYQTLLTNAKDTGDEYHSYFFVKSGNIIEKVNLHDILYIEAKQNYIAIHTPIQTIITYSSLKHVESYLPGRYFLKVQKSFIVALEKIDRIEGNQIIIGKATIAISRANKEEILKSIIGDRFLNKGY